MFVRTREDATFRKFVGVTLKNLVKNLWDQPGTVSNVTKNVSSAHKKLRVLLLNGVVLNAANVDIRNINVAAPLPGHDHCRDRQA